MAADSLVRARRMQAEAYNLQAASFRKQALVEALSQDLVRASKYEELAQVYEDLERRYIEMADRLEADRD